MQQVTAGYPRQVRVIIKWLYETKHYFIPRFSCESQIGTVCQDFASSLDEGATMKAMIIDFSKTFELVSHDRLITKIAASGMDSRVDVGVGEISLGCWQGVRVAEKLSV